MIPVGFIGITPDYRFRCPLHPDGCGASLSLGDVVVVNTTLCIFHSASWMIPVTKLDSVGAMTCTVGYIKVLCDQISLVGNRVGVVARMQFMKEPKLMLDVTSSGKKEVQVGMKKSTSKDKKGKFVTCKDFVKRVEQAASKDEDISKLVRSPTMNLVDTLMDIAWVMFIDGGTPVRAATVGPAEDRSVYTVSMGEVAVSPPDDVANDVVDVANDVVDLLADTDESTEADAAQTTNTTNTATNKKKGGNKKRSNEEVDNTGSNMFDLIKKRREEKAKKDKAKARGHESDDDSSYVEE